MSAAAALTAAGDATAPAAHRRGRPFVGREREIDTLASCLRTAAAGQGQLVAVVGEAGIGKTCTVEELLARADLPVERTLWGRCPEDEGVPAYWPWTQALRGCVERADASVLRAALGPAAAEVARLVPALRERLPDLPDTVDADPAQSRFRLFDGVTTFLQRLAAHEPHVLVLDDVHWADDATMLLLGHVVPEIRRSRLLIVCTYRDAEMRRTPRHLAQVVRADERLVLRGLDRTESARVVADTASASVPADLLARLHRVSGGNPYFLGELVRWLRAQDGLAAADLSCPLPDEMREVTRRRLAPVGAEVREVLAIAAAIGEDFDLRVLEGASGLPADRLSEQLAVATRDGFVRPSPRGPLHLEFVHAIVRETLYHDLTLHRRAELHRAITQALEAIPGGASVAELAHHAYHAAAIGDASKALAYALTAGGQALATLGYEDALRHYERALGMLALQEADPALELLARLGIGDAACRAGDHLRARAAFEEAAAVARSAGDADALAAAAIGFSESCPQSGVADPRLVRLLDDALAALGEADSVLRIRLLAALAEALYGATGEAERREQASRDAVAMARRVGDPAALASALNARHFTRGDELDARLAMAAESGRIARALPDQRRSLDAIAWLIGDLLELGDVAAVDRELEGLARSAQEGRLPFYQWVVMTLRASRALLGGRFADGERIAREARAMLPETEPTSFAEQVFTVQTSIADAELDRCADSASAVARLAERIPDVPGWCCSLAAIHLELGREADARVLLEQLAARDFADLPRDTGYPGALATLAHVAAALRDVPRARLLYDLLLPYAERAVVVGFGIACFGAAARSLAALAILLDRPADAVAHFERALALNARMGARVFLAYTQHEYAAFLAARGAAGDRERAEQLAAQARRAADELGMARLARLNTRTGGEPRHAREPAAGVFRRAGDWWWVGLTGEPFRVKDTKGMRYLAALLRHPGQELHVMVLAADHGPGHPAPGARAMADGDLRVGDPGDAGEMLDAEARAAYRSRLAELRDERDEAERFNDPGRVARAEHEIEILTRELARAVGLGGRARRAGAAAERARLNVSRAIAAALRKISAEHRLLGEHLLATIRTGTFCSYAADAGTPVRWDL